jgi:hypothetical protein
MFIVSIANPIFVQARCYIPVPAEQQPCLISSNRLKQERSLKIQEDILLGRRHAWACLVEGYETAETDEIEQRNLIGQAIKLKRMWTRV